MACARGTTARSPVYVTPDCQQKSTSSSTRRMTSRLPSGIQASSLRIFTSVPSAPNHSSWGAILCTSTYCTAIASRFADSCSRGSALAGLHGQACRGSSLSLLCAIASAALAAACRPGAGGLTAGLSAAALAAAAFARGAFLSSGFALFAAIGSAAGLRAGPCSNSLSLAACIRTEPAERPVPRSMAICCQASPCSANRVASFLFSAPPHPAARGRGGGGSPR